jgi:hypothetical protein
VPNNSRIQEFLPRDWLWSWITHKYKQNSVLLHYSVVHNCYQLFLISKTPWSKKKNTKQSKENKIHTQTEQAGMLKHTRAQTFKSTIPCLFPSPRLLALQKWQVWCLLLVLLNKVLFLHQNHLGILGKTEIPRFWDPMTDSVYVELKICVLRKHPSWLYAQSVPGEF